MVTAVVGSGGKTTLIKQLASEYRTQGKRVFVTTTTHMYREADTMVTEDAESVICQLQNTGYVMAGAPAGEKISAFSEKTYNLVCKAADEVLVEADGSRHMPLKYPSEKEPVIPDNVDRIIIVCGLHALGKKAKEVCHRLELVKRCLDITEDTLIDAKHVCRLMQEGYVRPLRERYPDKEIIIYLAHDGTKERKKIADWICSII